MLLVQFCAATIQGWHLFRKSVDIQDGWIRHVQNNTVMTVRCSQPLIPAVSDENESYNTNNPTVLEVNFVREHKEDFLYKMSFIPVVHSSI